MATTAEELCIREKVTDLLVRHWGMGRPLSYGEELTLSAALDEENKALCRDRPGGQILAELDEENKALHGRIHLRGLERLSEKGIT